MPGHQTVGRALDARGWRATAVDGSGPNGPITALVVVVDDARLPAALQDIEDVAADGFYTVHPLTRVHATPLPLALTQVQSRRT